MELTRLRWKNTCRLIPSVYPTTGILDRVASPRDLPLIFELESWTNDRISTEMGVLHRVPPEEWITGPQATVVMAAYCHPRPTGGRFNGPDRGAWYAARRLETAHAEIIYHRTAELAEIGVFDTRVQMRLYLADFSSSFHDLRGTDQDPDSYVESQRVARELFSAGSNGIAYRSVRHANGECIACFRPKLVANVRPDAHFEYRWSGSRIPVVRKL
ncbi:MAG TPA: RES family NAD+ phosphorylase [Bryobacteraceae bacterium]|nr:RES family NAD+ phosphorylase [Bryobacteraceae bacterium]